MFSQPLVSLPAFKDDLLTVLTHRAHALLLLLVWSVLSSFMSSLLPLHLLCFSTFLCLKCFYSFSMLHNCFLCLSVLLSALYLFFYLSVCYSNFSSISAQLLSLFCFPFLLRGKCVRGDKDGVIIR